MNSKEVLNNIVDSKKTPNQSETIKRVNGLIEKNTIFLKSELNDEKGDKNDVNDDDLIQISDDSDIEIIPVVKSKRKIVSNRRSNILRKKLQIPTKNVEENNVNYIINMDEIGQHLSGVNCALLLPNIQELTTNCMINTSNVITNVPVNNGSRNSNLILNNGLPIQNAILLQSQDVHGRPILLNNVIIQNPIAQTITNNVTGTNMQTITQNNNPNTILNKNYPENAVETNILNQRLNVLPKNTNTVPNIEECSDYIVQGAPKGAEVVVVRKPVPIVQKKRKVPIPIKCPLSVNSLEVIEKYAYVKTPEGYQRVSVVGLDKVNIEDMYKTKKHDDMNRKVTVEIIPDDFEMVTIKEEHYNVEDYEEIEIVDLENDLNEDSIHIKSENTENNENESNKKIETITLNYSFIRTSDGNDALQTTHIPTDHELAALSDSGIKYVCDVCGKPIISKKQLEIHVRLHDADYLLANKFKCNKCPNVYKTNKMLLAHVYYAHTEVKFKCDVCGMKYHTNEGLHNHKIVHETQSDRFKCDQCGKVFNKRISLYKHSQTHGERLNKCTECSVSFSRKDNLQMHMKIHRKEKDFRCKLCGKAFVRSDNLKAHMKRHGKETSFKCNECGETFSKEYNFKMHCKNSRIVCKPKGKITKIDEDESDLETIEITEESE